MINIKYIAIITLLIFGGAAYTNADMFIRVVTHLERSGITNGLDLISSGDIQIANHPGQDDEIVAWNVPGTVKPRIEELLPADVAGQFYSVPLKYRRVIPVYPYFEILTEAEVAAIEAAAEDERQSKKSDVLKSAERRVIAFLKAEGFIDVTAKKFTPEQILAMHATLDLMADQDVADGKRAKYDSLIRRVETAGGTEFDTYDHPAP